VIAKALDVTPDYLLGVEIELEAAEDKAFFRKYQKMKRNPEVSDSRDAGDH
jgi:hypothetical protein